MKMPDNTYREIIVDIRDSRGAEHRRVFWAMPDLLNALLDQDGELTIIRTQLRDPERYTRHDYPELY